MTAAPTVCEVDIEPKYPLDTSTELVEPIPTLSIFKYSSSIFKKSNPDIEDIPTFK